MSLQTAGDLPLQITSENSSSERRITPSWSIGQLKAKLEPITGIPPLSQKLTLKLGNQQSVPVEAVDEENTQLGSFPLAPYAEIHVSLQAVFYCSLHETVYDTWPPCFVLSWQSRCPMRCLDFEFATMTRASWCSLFSRSFGACLG